jgi:hypothetical protein
MNDKEKREKINDILLKCGVPNWGNVKVITDLILELDFVNGDRAHKRWKELAAKALECGIKKGLLESEIAKLKAQHERDEKEKNISQTQRSKNMKDDDYIPHNCIVCGTICDCNDIDFCIGCSECMGAIRTVDIDEEEQENDKTKTE